MSDAICCGCAYATIDDLRDGGVPEKALAQVALNKQEKALLTASRMADTYLRDKYLLPLVAPFDPVLTQWVVWLATYILFGVRGWNPNTNQPDMTVVMNYKDAIASLVRVADGKQQLCVTQTSPGSEQPQLGTNQARGFGGPGGVDVPFVGPNTWGN